MTEDLKSYMDLKLVNEFKDHLTKFQEQQLESLIVSFGKKFLIKIENKEAVYRFLKYNVDGDWVERLKIIREKLKHDSSSVYAFQIRYGENKGYELWVEKTKKTTQNLEAFISKYGQEKGEEEFLKYNQSKKSIGVDVMKKRYGNELGEEKWLNYLSKWRSSVRDKGGWDNGLTLENLQKKHGKHLGYEVWNKKREKQSYRFSVEYYIEKFGEVEGKKKWSTYCKSMDKKSLKYFIEKYGKDKGKELYKKSCDQTRYYQTLEYYVQKYGNKLGEEKFNQKKENTILSLKKLLKIGYSKISQELFWILYDNILDNSKKVCMFAELNQEESFYLKNSEFNVITVDFKVGNKIIEFYGDFWHANPKLYESDFVFERDNMKKTAKLIQDRDIRRVKKIEDFGYEVYIVWESEFKTDRHKTIEKCLNFLKENNDE
jgi:hypothetical protein